jgi:hypothetical protein
MIMHRVPAKFDDYLKTIEIMPQINSGSEFIVDDRDIRPTVCSLLLSMMEQTPFSEETLPAINFSDDPQEGKDPAFKRTGYYDLLSNTICIFTNGRSTKDILRSIAHEMIHADQYHNKGWNLEPAVNGLGEGSLKHAEEIEGDAYRRGNLALRKWEDRLKAKFS